MNVSMGTDDASLATIAQALTHGGLYVDPTLVNQVPEAIQVQLKAAIAQSPTPIFVVAMPLPYDDVNFHGRTELLLGTLHTDIGLDGVYVGTELNGETPRTSAYDYGTGSEAFYAGAVAVRLHPTDLSQQLLSTVEQIASGTAAQAYAKLPARTASQTQPASRPDDESHDGAAVVGVSVLLLVLVLIVLGVRKSRTRLPAKAKPGTPGSKHLTNRPFELPTSVLSTIRATRDRQQDRRADSDVLALGERIDATTMTDGVGDQAWQAALDHYDLARRILQREHSQADVVGAIVLAGRGQQALDAAVAGQPYEPVRPCYLNPLHGPGTVSVRWAGAAGSAEVPMCGTCSAAVRRDETPDDVLDFVVDGVPRHYFDLAIEPWSSTGYGALEPDLLTRLFTGR